MFTGIIETMGLVILRETKGSNLLLTIQSAITAELKIDQSVSHNGICLTVTGINSNDYTVTAIEETIQRSNIGQWQIGNKVNLERSMRLGDRLDGHMVQGHVDCVAELVTLEERDGSWWLEFQFPAHYRDLLVEKGSICINGISLTVAACTEETFSVAIIPYTWENTNLQHLWVGELVNIEFDVAAKYYIQTIRRYVGA